MNNIEALQQQTLENQTTQANTNFSIKRELAIIGASAVAAFGATQAEAAPTEFSTSGTETAHASSTGVYILGSPEAKRKSLELQKKCNVGTLAIAPEGYEGDSARNSKLKISLKAIDSEDGKRRKYVWTHPSNVYLTGYYAPRDDGRVLIKTTRPSQDGKLGGRLLDPNPLTSPKQIQSFVACFRKKR